MIGQARILLAAGIAVGVLALGMQADAQSAPDSKTAAGKNSKSAKSDKKSAASDKKDKKSAPAKAAKAKPAKKPTQVVTTGALPAVPYAGPTPPADVSHIKTAVGFARQGKTSQAAEVLKDIGDPVGRKLVEWAILRSDDNNVGFSRYASFISSNPTWPSIGFLRRRAEAMLWQERASPATVRAFFAQQQPLTAKGRFALARALLAQGDRAAARDEVRYAWWNDAFSGDLEDQAIETFGSLLSADDHKARMDMRLYAEDVEGGLRSANRAGGNAPAIARARIAVIRKAGNADSLFNALPSDAKRDIGAIFSHAQWLRRDDDAGEAARFVLSVPNDSSAALDTDQWWIERRLIARKLLDEGDIKTAYLVARDAATPARENYRIEHQFTAGWIALRFLNDAGTAKMHFAKMAEGVTNPISLGRAGYWLGRTAEAMGRQDEARTHYQAAARYPTSYYGQIARARLGLKDLPLRPSPDASAGANLEVVRAADLLYAIGARDLVTAMLADLGDRLSDPVALAALGEVAIRNKDARAALHVGKAALARGLPLEHYAFPTIGIPDYRAVGPAIEIPVVYAIARQESTFHQPTVSSAKAMGLMQVTPEAGRYVAKKFGQSFDVRRLLSDPVYNVQLGSAELGDLASDYRGSYIMTFAGYNAGRGRVKDWITRFGDPRNPDVDPIDWVERIPFSETRNYVQRVLENLQVYRVRFGGGSKLQIEADLRRGGSVN